jgi:V8-like Glu-specific endopeptidase
MAVTVAAGLSFASAATAIDSASYFGKGAKPERTGPKPKPRGDAKTVGTGPRSRVRPRAYRPIRNGRRCRTVRGTRTCTYFRNSRAYRICIKKQGARERCRRLRRTSTAAYAGKVTGPWMQTFPPDVESSPQEVARLAGLNNHGLTNPLMPPVGRIFNNGEGNCSGTLIGVGIVLTAAHCLYENKLMSKNPTGYTKDAVTFNPGNTFIQDYDLPDPRYGEWAAKKFYVPQGWADGDSSMDYAFIELWPQGGNYPGQVTGTWSAMANITWNRGAQVYAVGYPASGDFSSFHRGNGQYFCEVTWDGHTTDGNYPAKQVFLAHQCPMTGGASGGAVFVRLANGSWSISGVVNQAYPNAVKADWTESAYLDQRFIDYYRHNFG